MGCHQKRLECRVVESQLIANRIYAGQPPQLCHFARQSILVEADPPVKLEISIPPKAVLSFSLFVVPPSPPTPSNERDMLS